MFQLENEIFVNGLAFRKRFHGDGNVSCFAKGWKLRAGGCVECDSVFGSRPSRLVRVFFVSIDYAPLPDRISRFRLPLKGGFTASGKI